MSEIILHEGERLDKTGFGDLAVIQGKGFSYGVDTVLLTGFANGEMGAPGIKEDARIVDLGTGNGIIPFIMSHKHESAHIDGIEVQEVSYDRAMRGLAINGLSDRIKFINMDVLGIRESMEAESYDAVVTNPPYFRRGAAMISNASSKMIARHETTATLEDFIKASVFLLKPGADFYMVHRPDRMVSILSLMRLHGIEPKTLQLVAPRAGTAANILLVHGIKGAGEELRILPEIYVYKSPEEYSDIIMKLYERI